MKILHLAGLTLACAALSACNGVGGLTGVGNGAAGANTALGQFLSDPNCAHHDEATFVTGAGGLPASFQAKVLRDCPARPAAVAAPATPTP